MTEQFDAWLERELQRQLNAVAPHSPRPAQAWYQAAMPSRRYGMLRILPAAAAAKAIAAVAAVSAAGAGAATAGTRSPHPPGLGPQGEAHDGAWQDGLETRHHGDCGFRHGF